MKSWSNNPVIYEINTWVWLSQLSEDYGYEINLCNVPDKAIKELAQYRFDAIWMMGVWFRSKATRNSALNYIDQYRGALPDITKDDVIGSGYAIGAYEVDERIGGREGLARFRAQLQAYSIKLILDFVPNHVATDHPWTIEHPEYFVTGTAEAMQSRPSDFFQKKVKRKNIVFAHGRDPYFPGWIDTAQLNAFSDDYRQVTTETLRDIASQCDGVRCDMAMLMMNSIFQQTWGWFAGTMPETDYWEYVIPRIRTHYPDFLFMAEVYWNLESALQEQGFDLTYDKRLYDRIVHTDVNKIYDHLNADFRYVEKNIRFIENHDEPRAKTTIGPAKSRPAATLICTLPGATLLHDGQFTGRKAKLPVQIKRQPVEKPDEKLKQFYQWLLKEKQALIYQRGEWTLFARHASINNNNSHFQIIAYGWRYHSEIRLIVLNFSGAQAEALVELNKWAMIAQSDWEIREVRSLNSVVVSGKDLTQFGFYVQADPYAVEVFEFRAMKPGTFLKTD